MLSRRRQRQEVGQYYCYIQSGRSFTLQGRSPTRKHQTGSIPYLTYALRIRRSVICIGLHLSQVTSVRTFLFLCLFSRREIRGYLYVVPISTYTSDESNRYMRRVVSRLQEDRAKTPKINTIITNTQREFIHRKKQNLFIYKTQYTLSYRIEKMHIAPKSMQKHAGDLAQTLDPRLI